MSLWTAIGLVLAAGLLCGLVTGMVSRAAPPGRGRGRLWTVNWLLFTATLVAVGFGLPASGWVAGRPALWLEAAALLVPAYLVGCAAGCAVRRAPAKS